MPESSGANLTQVAYLGRQGIKIAGITLVTLIVGRVFLSAAVGYWVSTHPPAPPPPTVGFGRLPSLNFPTNTDTEKPTSYQLQTGNGAFPAFPDRAKVFLMTKSSPNLLADQRAKEVAANIGFTAAPTVLNDRSYRWSKFSPLEATLTLDIQNYTFNITTNYLTKPELLAQNNLPDEQNATALVKGLISSAGGVGNDIATVSGNVSYLKAIGGEVTPAVSFSDADFLEVDLNRAAIDKKWPSFTSNGINGIIHAVVAGSFQDRNNIMEITNNYHKIDYSEVQTYPIRTPDSAWQTLQAGEGYIAQKGTSDTAVVRKVVLGYFDDAQEQEYYQPIYVFTGDNGFIGYVPAIAGIWIATPATPTQ